MSFEGDLKDLSLGDMFQTITQNRQTGTLSLTVDRQQKARIHFEEGKIALYSPDDTTGPTFAEVLRRLGAVPEKDLATAEKKRGRKALRTVLEERGLLAPEEYRAAAEKYLFDEVADIFLRAKGRFQFQEGEAPRGAFDADLKSARAAVDPQGVAFEGLRRQDEWTRISRQIRGFGDIFLPSRPLAPEDEESLSAEAKKLYELLDGCRSLEECMEHMPCARFGTGAAVVELLALNVIAPATGDEVGARAKDMESKGNFDEAERLYRRALDIERNHLGLREQLAHLLERLGRPEEAGRERTLLGLGRLGERDLQGAIAEYRRAAELLPNDTASLERVLELERERRNPGGTLAAGKRLGERYMALKLPGRARDLYRDLIHEFPEDTDLRARLAEALNALGDRREAASAWKEIARLREKERDEAAALEAYEKALAVDHEDEEARKRGELIRSGRLEQQRVARRRYARIAALALACACAGAWATREALALAALHAWALRAVDPGEAQIGSILYQGFESVRSDFPFTIASWQSRAFGEAAVRQELSRSSRRLAAEGDTAKALERLKALEALALPPELMDAVRATRAEIEGRFKKNATGSARPAAGPSTSEARSHSEKPRDGRARAE